MLFYTLPPLLITISIRSANCISGFGIPPITAVPTYRYLILAHRDIDKVFDLIQNPPAKTGLEFFSPETHVPMENGEETQRIRAAGTLIERIASNLHARKVMSKTPIDPAYVQRLEENLAEQERQRSRLEAEISELREQMKQSNSGGLSRLWGNRRGK